MRPSSSALLLVFAAACGAPAGPEAGTTDQASTAATSPDRAVLLRLAYSTVECAGGDCSAGTIQHTHYSLLLENLAYDKQVSIHLTSPDGATSDVAAHYVRSTGDGREVGAADRDYSSFRGEAPRDLAFDVRFGENGRLHVDDDGGRGYAIGQNAWATLSLDDVLLESASLDSRQAQMTLALYVKNLAYQKALTVVYTTDHWATTRTAAAHYTGATLSFGGAPIANPDAAGVERWIATVPVSAQGPLEFAIAYDVNGATRWDNDFHRNYVVPPGGTLSN